MTHRPFVLIKLTAFGRQGVALVCLLRQVVYNSGRIGFHDQPIPIPSPLTLPVRGL